MPIASPSARAAVDRRVARVDPADHLDQPHQRRRVEEVHADDVRRLGRGGREERDRDRRRVRGEHRLGAADLREVARTARASARAARAPPRSRSRSRPGPRARPRRAGGPRRRRRPPCSSGPRSAPFARFARVFSMPAASASATGSCTMRLDARERAELRDPGTHRAGADDAEAARRHAVVGLALLALRLRGFAKLMEPDHLAARAPAAIVDLAAEHEDPHGVLSGTPATSRTTRVASVTSSARRRSESAP